MNASWARREVAAPEFTPHRADIATRLPHGLALKQQAAASEPLPLNPDRVRRLLDAGGYSRLPASAGVVYRLRTHLHQQTGIIVEVATHDYRSGRIRRHEATDPERERQVEEATRTTGLEQMPVMLAHRPRARLRKLISDIATGTPLLHITANGTEHTLWIAPHDDLAQAVHAEISQLTTLYIADGHHRMIAAEGRPASWGEHHGASGFTLAALFPSDETRILSYHRCFRTPTGSAAEKILEKLAAQAVIKRIEETGPEMSPLAPGEIAMRLEDRQYRLFLHDADPHRDPRASLDVVALDELLIPPVRGMSTVANATPSNLRHDGATGGCACAGGNAISFRPCPPSIEQIMAVSDAGSVMPPKSTWFEPKAMNGLLVREVF